VSPNKTWNLSRGSPRTPGACADWPGDPRGAKRCPSGPGLRTMEPGILNGRQPGQRSLATLTPRFAAWTRESTFDPRESFLMDGLRAAGQTVIHSALLFKREPAARSRSEVGRAHPARLEANCTAIWPSANSSPVLEAFRNRVRRRSVACRCRPFPIPRLRSCIPATGASCGICQ